MSTNIGLGKHLDATGLSQVWAEILANFGSKKELTVLADKLGNIADGAQVNVIESVKVNGVALAITEKGVNIEVPTGALAKLDKVGKEQLDTELAELINSYATKATTLAGYGIEDAYTKEETKTEIDTAVKAAVAGVYKVKGSIVFSDLDLASIAEGYVYNITDAFVTTENFVEGVGVQYPAGTNVVAVMDNDTLKWDVMAGTYDFSDFVKKDDITPLTSEEIEAICVMPE